MKRTYLVVGHSSGIGLALTRMALDAGHAVVGLSRRAPEELELNDTSGQDAA